MTVTRPDADLTGSISTLASIAALSAPSSMQRRAYFDALLAIYHSLPDPPTDRLRDLDTLFVGIKREGCFLAQELAWLPQNHMTQPDAKRMPFNTGLLVGLSGLPQRRNWRELVIVDGAIASGSTLITVMCAFDCPSIRIYSAHATEAGLRAVSRCGTLRGINVKASVGYVTGELDRDYYAVQGHGRKSSLIVGDLGDKISPLFKNQVIAD
jgi:hypothetical protein